jgi:hypothetical protein
MIWSSSLIGDRSIRRQPGRLARCTIVLLTLFVATGCSTDPTSGTPAPVDGSAPPRGTPVPANGSAPPRGTPAPANGSAPSTLTKRRLEKLRGQTGVPPGGQTR